MIKEETIMQVKILVSILAVGTALAFAGPVSAQPMINGAAISAEDLPKVQARCDELANAGETESLVEDEENGGGEAGEAAEADATVESVPQTNQVDEATTSSIDLETVTLEACTEAGLTTAAP
jgi:hypothetical protein